VKQESDKVFLVEWENYEMGIPQHISLLPRKRAEAQATKFRASRNRRADIIPATKETRALYFYLLG